MFWLIAFYELFILWISKDLEHQGEAGPGGGGLARPPHCPHDGLRPVQPGPHPFTHRSLANINYSLIYQ